MTFQAVLKGFHSSRVFRSFIVDVGTVVTAGEDGNVGVWDVSEERVTGLVTNSILFC